jgi:fructose-specific PTS system IIA-like component
MSSVLRFAFPLSGGMHARPASALEHAARRFAADVSVTNLRTGQTANAKSVLGIVGLDIREGDSCRLEVTGPDAETAIESLTGFIERALPHVDDAAPRAQATAMAFSLPPMLRREQATTITGTPVVAGIGIGRAFVMAGRTVPDSLLRTGAGDVAAEAARVERALDRLQDRYDARLGASARSLEDDLLRAHRSVARDPEFAETIARGIRERDLTAAGAIAEAETHFTEMLAATGSAVLRERALDIRDVCRALLREVYGDTLPTDDIVLEADAVCVAETLTPAQLLSLDREHVKGLVLVQGGTTSHTVILARSRGIPTVVGVEGLDPAALDGHEVIVDADLGAVVTGLTPSVRRYYDMERRRLDRRRARVRRFIERPATTFDGRRMEVAANVGSAADVAEAVAGGADGVGLFRTEMLFLARPSAPSEEEQFDEYRRAIVDAAGRPVIVRTLDVGGDKPLPYLTWPKEGNPFLGLRGVRIYPEFEALFRTQVRALLRASAFGSLRMMIPMVARLDEAAWVRRIVTQERAALATAGVAFDRPVPLGAMIEVPSAALMIGQLSVVLDFFSLGTNDLLQYFAAVDRTNPRLASMADPLEPSFIRLLHQVVTDAHAAGRWVGLCGEMGGQARCLPLMIGLGLDEISLAAPDIAAIRGLLADLSGSGCAALVERAMEAATSREVEQLLDERGHWREMPLTEPDLVELDVDGRTKEEAIKAAVDLLSAAGRTDRPREIEEAVWRREETYSTGFGHGFAIPHCQTDAAAASSMAIVKLRAGVDWNAIDGQLVRTVILLVVREAESAGTHMRVLASLARRLMHEDFRADLEREQDPAALCALLKQEFL